MSDINRDFIAASSEKGAFSRAVTAAKATVALWRERVRQRRELAELTFRDVQEIGLDQAEIDREIAKPFWVA